MRPSREQYFLRMASLAATRGTCFRRQVGCILVNERGHVLATGYNGVAAGLPHCNEGKIGEAPRVGDQTFDIMPINYPNVCKGAMAPSGTNLEACEAIHAEQNALLQCRDAYEIHTCYVTHSPCVTCVKLLMNTSCKRIIFIDRYAHDEQARRLWQMSDPGKVWWHYGH